MIDRFIPALAVAALPTMAAAQFTRQPIDLGTSSSTKGLASSGDFTVAFWRFNVNDQLLRMATSDGRGVEWSDEFVLSDESGWADVMDVDMLSNRVYALWTTGQTSVAPDRVVHARSTDGGNTWSAPQALPLLESFDQINRIVEIRAQATPSGDEIYALVRDTPTRLTPFRSIDGGLSYQKGQPLTTTYETSGKLVLTDGVVHLVYRENQGSNGLLVYRRSTDGGASFEPRVVLQSIPMAEGFAFVEVGADGDNVVCATLSQSLGLQTHASTDAGASFAPAVTQPTGALYFTDIEVLVRGDEVFLGHAENVGTFPENTRPLLVTRSADAGATWAAAVPSVDDMGSSPELALVQAGPDVVASVGSAAFPTSVVSASIWDPSSLSFGTSFLAIDEPDAREALVVGNELYGNVIYLYENGAPARSKTGGFRPQTLVPSGFESASTGVSFDFERFDDDSTVGWTLFALQSGDWILPDGRNLGLAQDALTVSSITFSLQGLTSAPLVAGAGSTPVLPVGIPPGLEFFAVGIGVDLSQGLVAAITDVVPIDT